MRGPRLETSYNDEAGECLPEAAAIFSNAVGLPRDFHDEISSSTFSSRGFVESSSRSYSAGPRIL